MIGPMRFTCLLTSTLVILIVRDSCGSRCQRPRRKLGLKRLWLRAFVIIFRRGTTLVFMRRFGVLIGVRKLKLLSLPLKVVEHCKKYSLPVQFLRFFKWYCHRLRRLVKACWIKI